MDSHAEPLPKELRALLAARTKDDVKALKKDLEGKINSAIGKLREDRGKPAALSFKNFEVFVRQVAEHLSDIRKVEKIFAEHGYRLDHIRDLPSSDHEREEDWRNARAFAALKVIEPDEALDLPQLDPRAYPLLEKTGLQRVKHLKAYYIWQREGTGSAAGDYAASSAYFRHQLFRYQRAPLEQFDPIKRYIEELYLSNLKLNGRQKSRALIGRKAARLWQMAEHKCEDPVNWLRAELYSQLFYENIIGAVVNSDADKTAAVLKAFQFGKGARNQAGYPTETRFYLINSFEAAIAIYFLNKDVIRDVLETPDRFVFTFEPADDWPENVQKPGRLTYRKEARLLQFHGVMTEEEKRELGVQLSSHAQHACLEALFCRSRFEPASDQIL